MPFTIGIVDTPEFAPNNIVGYFCADDHELVATQAEAAQYETREAAEAARKRMADTWDLPFDERPVVCANGDDAEVCTMPGPQA